MTQPTHVSGTIKPLEWDEILAARSDEDPTTEFTGEFEAECLLGVYRITMGFGSDCYYWGVTTPDGEELGNNFEDPLWAKAAAQDDYEARILAQIQPDAEPIGWQTIETAPRDGTPFLAYGGSYVYECWFVNDPYDGSYLQDHADSEPNPTHWMPRPADPPRPIRALPAPSSEVGNLISRPDLLRKLTGAHINRPLMNAHQKDAWDAAFRAARTIVRALPAARAEVSVAEAARTIVQLLDNGQGSVEGDSLCDILSLHGLDEETVADALRALTEAGQ